MYIESVTLTNFQCFGPEPTTITLESGVTALIGSNGTGKTAACQALLRLFGVTADERTVRPSDFHVGSAPTPTATATVTAGDESVPAATSSSTRNLSVEVLLRFPELDADDGQSDAVPAFFQRMAADVDGTLKCRIRLESNWLADGTIDGAVDTSCWVIPTLENDYDDDVRVKLPASERGRIQMLYVPASRDGARQVATFLRGRLWRAARWSQELRDKVSATAVEVRNAFHAEPATNAVETVLAARWAQLHGAGTHATPHFEPLDADVNAMLRGAELVFEPDHTSARRPAQQLSDGQRSLLHLALTAATLDLEAGIAGTTPESFDVASLRLPVLTLLAVEEPENNLSPFYLSRIVTQLLQLGDGARAQIVLSSHSPNVLTRIHPGSVRFFRVEPSTNVANVRPITLPADETEASKYVREAVQAHPELYFARFVILGEGASEEIVIPRIARAYNLELDPSFVAVVPLGGRHTNHFWRLLNDLHIPHATLLDLDYGRAGAGPARLRYVCTQLSEYGTDVLTTSTGFDAPADITDDLDLNAMAPILEQLRTAGVFFSHPLDLDMAMLKAYPDAYRQLDVGALGPGGSEATKAVLGSTLTGAAATYWTPADPSALVSQQDLLSWYRYLFLNRSKPGTHLQAINRLSLAELRQPPKELAALVAHISTRLAL